MDLSADTILKLERYRELLVAWQDKINLVGRSTLGDFWRRHILDSGQLFPLLPDSGRGPLVLVDLGSGAGFPGLVLAILASGAGRAIAVHLVESDQRKAAFLAEAARRTGVAATVRIHAARIERLAPGTIPPADVVTARALAPLDRLLGLAAPLLAPDGICLFLKGAGVEGELTAAAKTWKMRATRHASRSDPSGTVLKIEGLAWR